jgi:hypothetical protein
LRIRITFASKESFRMPTDCSQICSCSAWLTCGAATIALGLCRFACVLLLPRTHSLLYVVNTIGFLVGILGARVIVRRVGMLNAIGIAIGACLLSLAVSTLTTQLTVLGVELAQLGAVR